MKRGASTATPRCPKRTRSLGMRLLDEPSSAHCGPAAALPSRRYVTPGLSSSAGRRAHRSGPRAVASRAAQARPLASAGFIDIGEIDLTDEFATTSRAWIEEWDRHADELRTLEGSDAFEERQRDRRVHLSAVEEGLLRRGLFSARRPN